MLSMLKRKNVLDGTTPAFYFLNLIYLPVLCNFHPEQISTSLQEIIKSITPFCYGFSFPMESAYFVHFKT